MRTRETFYRLQEIRRETRSLPAKTYNLTRILLTRSDEAVFVPIRSMLYLAVIDHEEIIFVDAAVSRSKVVLAWQKFAAGERTGLGEPIRFEVVYYDEESLGILPRLQGEFQKALEQLERKGQSNRSGRVVPLK